MMPREAVILAGGFGTRLRAVVSDVPKPLAPVAGRPFLWWLVDGLARQGIERLVVASGYLGHMIAESLGPRFAGVHIVYHQEETPLGTGGAIWAALSCCQDDRAFVLNGDTWFDVSLPELAATAPAADIVLAVRPVEDRSRYGSVSIEGNRILGLNEKGPGGFGLVNGGVYLMRRDIISRRPFSGAFSLEAEILATPGDLDLRAYNSSATFLDIGTPEDYARAQELIPQWAAKQAPGRFLSS